MVWNAFVNRFRKAASLSAVAVSGLSLALFAAASCSSDSDDGTSSSGGSSGSGATNTMAGKSGSGSGGTGNSCASCGPGQMCSNGTCVCQPGLRTCGGVCINQYSDPKHCGGCNMACTGATPVCNVGVCSAVCGQGLVTCNGACVNDQTDPFNCGGCGKACSTGQNCLSGVCSGGQGSGGSGAGGSSGTGGGSSAGTGGLSAGGTAGGGGGSAGGGGNTPPGYWTQGDWHGCAWTAIDSLAGSTTMNTPRDFTSHTPGTPYCVSGQVHPSTEAVALLGFHLNQPMAGASCSYPDTANPPGVMLTGGTGIAGNFSKQTAAPVRIQIQGPDARTDANQRWCYLIQEVSGKFFAPFDQFNTKCWDGTGSKYTGQPVSAIVFLVPGAPNQVEFNYCVDGFVVGSSIQDAPEGSGSGGPLKGTIGGPGPRDLDFQRVKVTKGNKEYVIQNNNWGQPEGSDQTITYSDNSFTVVSSTGSTSGQGVPASFPSIFIGNNGNTMNGIYSTKATDNLPKQISQIQKVMSTFRYSGGTGGRDYNAAYDIWFAASPPTGEYQDGISGFVMLWLYKPPNHNPIGWGSKAGTYSGGGHNWDVYRGPRGGSGPNSGAPVVSYIATSTISGVQDIDLKPFMVDAAKYGIQSSWYLTDVFAGFEIWSGGDATGLKVEEFTAVVQ